MEKFENFKIIIKISVEVKIQIFQVIFPTRDTEYQLDIVTNMLLLKICLRDHFNCVQV
jgi:hypothetical protein